LDEDDTEAYNPSSGSKSSPTDILAVLQSTKSASLFENVLSNYYLPLESWYLRAIIDKSHRLSTVDSSASPPQNTAPDDIFYILKVILTRMISIGALNALKGSTADVKGTMEKDFAGVIRAKMDEVYAGRAGGNLTKNEKAEKESRAVFMVRSMHHAYASF